MLSLPTQSFQPALLEVGDHPRTAFQGPKPWHGWLQWQNLISHHRHCGTLVPGLVSLDVLSQVALPPCADQSMLRLRAAWDLLEQAAGWGGRSDEGRVCVRARPQGPSGPKGSEGLLHAGPTLQSPTAPARSHLPATQRGCSLQAQTKPSQGPNPSPPALRLCMDAPCPHPHPSPSAAGYSPTRRLGPWPLSHPS